MKGVSRYIEENYTGRIVEVGVGGYTEVAETLGTIEGIEVVATDKKDIDNIDLDGFVVDDINSPSLDIYRGADLIYSVRPPVEIVGSLREIAEIVGSDLLVVPLHGDDIPGPYRLINRQGDVIYKLDKR